jgi:rhodanese-related sulfurtransferase
LVGGFGLNEWSAISEGSSVSGAGHGKVWRMNQSLPEIEVSQIPADTDTPLHILDVREGGEWEAGHIDGAHHIPMMDVPARLAEIPTEGKVLVVCRSGHRSARVVGFLTSQGLDAVNLSGGMQAWTSAGRAMTGSPGQAPQVM